MILTCDNCHTRYLVPHGAIGPEGREVRCTSCHHQWFQEPEEELPLPPPEEIEPIPEAIMPVPEGSALPVLRYPPVIDNRGRNAGYLAAAAVFLLIFVGLVVGRAKVVHAWLPSIRLYQALHIAPPLPGEGLSFEDLKAAITMNEQGVKALNVTGTLVNTRGKPVKVPPLRVSILLDDGSVFYGWNVDSPQPDIGAHGKADFKTSYDIVPENAKEVRVDLLLTH